MKAKNIALTLKNELKNHLRGMGENVKEELSSKYMNCVEEVRTQGYCVIPNFLKKSWCDKAVEEIDRVIIDYKDVLWRDEVHSDHRIFGADRVSGLIHEYFTNSLLLSMTNEYMEVEMKAGFTLGARLEARKGNAGSGGGWHRDSASRKQFKTIAYLSDVDEENGPFQFIEDSHHSKDMIMKIWDFDLDYNQTRFSEEEVQAMIDKEPSKLISFKAGKGCVILVDTRGIHRGAPIQSGLRYALTNYRWDTVIPDALERDLVKY